MGVWPVGICTTREEIPTLSKQEKDFTKLPKWAQEHINSLQRERDIAVRALNKWTDAQTVSRVYATDNLCIGETRGLSLKQHYIQHERLTFRLGDGEDSEVYVGIDHRDNHILSINTGGMNLIFQPQAANHIYVITQE